MTDRHFTRADGQEVHTDAPQTPEEEAELKKSLHEAELADFERSQELLSHLHHDQLPDDNHGSF
jgi:hypothetical protein